MATKNKEEAPLNLAEIQQRMEDLKTPIEARMAVLNADIERLREERRDLQSIIDRIDGRVRVPVADDEGERRTRMTMMQKYQAREKLIKAAEATGETGISRAEAASAAGITPTQASGLLRALTKEKRLKKVGDLANTKYVFVK